ncbi:MAG: NPCBM/NEW2 domain-containing protein [Firmicutes bacterium]|nr:NPCBM/NEW2 domain-containing protein [Bacillota bacterium]
MKQKWPRSAKLTIGALALFVVACTLIMSSVILKRPVLEVTDDRSTTTSLASSTSATTPTTQATTTTETEKSTLNKKDYDDWLAEHEGSTDTELSNKWVKLKAYEGGQKLSINNPVKIGGQEYDEGICLEYTHEAAMYNLEGKYETVTLSAGIPDGNKGYTRKLLVYGDGEQLAILEISKSDLLKTFSIDTAGINQLSIYNRFVPDPRGGYVTFYEPVLITDEQGWK